MHVLVTGGTGFVGSHTVRALQSAGHRVRLLVRSREKAERLFGDAVPAEVLTGDVLDPVAVAAALDGVEAVVHCAALVATDAGRAQEVLDTNVRSVELVVGGAHQRGIDRIVYVSSVIALFAPGKPIDEHSPSQGTWNAYAESKTEGDRYVRELQARGAPVCTLYPPAVIGPDDPGLSEGNRAVRVFSTQLVLNTTTGFEAVDVRDLSAMIAACVALGQPGRHIVSGCYVSWSELIALFEDLTGRPVRQIRVNGAILRALGRLGDRVQEWTSLASELSSEAMSFLTQWPGTVNSPTLGSAELELHSAHDTYSDTIRWLHRAGHITSRQAGRLAS